MPKPPVELPSTQQLAWLMVRPVALLEEIGRHLLIHVCQDATINQVYELAKEFAVMVGGHQVEALGDWLARCQNSSAALLQQFGLRLHQDNTAVREALATEWSINRGTSNQSQAYQAADVWASKAGFITTTSPLRG